MSDMFMALSLHNDGTELHVHWGVLCPFVSAERILKEFGLANEHDPRVAAYNETLLKEGPFCPGTICSRGPCRTLE